MDRTVIEGRRTFAELLNDRKGQLEKPHYAEQVHAIVAAMVRAFRAGNKVLWFGNGGGTVAEVADLALIGPDGYSAIVQEVHITLGHIICDLVEQELIFA